jgi:hypothetical protein
MVRRTLFLLVLLGCKGGTSTARGPVADTLESADYVPRDSLDSALNSPRLLTQKTVVVFWIHAGDTLNPEDAASVLEDLNYYTEKVSPALTLNGIDLVPTNADTVYLALPNNRRRAILLTGLEFPFGYLLVDPDGPERILAGVYADDELLDEITAYFDLEVDSTKARPRVTT